MLLESFSLNYDVANVWSLLFSSPITGPASEMALGYSHELTPLLHGWHSEVNIELKDP